MKIGIIDYGVGNLASICNALKRLDAEPIISQDLSVLKKTDALILPGDGAAGKGMDNLSFSGLDVFIKKEIQRGKPFLGICLGMQLLLDSSEEGNVGCLGVISGSVKKFEIPLKVPQIGWNTLRHSGKRSNERIQNLSSVRDPGQARMTLLKAVPNNSYFYFINSFVCEPEDKSIITGTTEYGETFCSAFEKNNIFGVQFHPEKSGKAGMQLLKNFIVIANKMKQSRNLNGIARSLLSPLDDEREKIL